MNIAIIDDLKTDRMKISDCLCTFFSHLDINVSSVVTEFVSGEAFLETFEKSIFQLILIDYYMDGISGMETARSIREKDTEVVLIFITASSDYAVDGYRVRASGYLVKPFSYDNFEETMKLIDIKKMIDRQFIQLDAGSGQVRVLLNDIIYCDIDRHYVCIHAHRMGVLKFRMTFQKLTDLLLPFNQFLACYRGCIINMARVKKMEELNFCMNNGERIPFRKKEQAILKKIYTDYLFEKVRESQG